MSSTVLSISRRRSRVVLSLTPLIDVVFILLVFFMLVSQFISWQEVDLIPQSALGQAANEEPSLVVSITADDTIDVGGKAASSFAQAAALASKQAGVTTPVIVRPVGDVAIQPVVSLIEAFADAGIENVQVESVGGGG